jgi:hypothetical protein
MCDTCFILLHLVILIISSEECKYTVIYYAVFASLLLLVQIFFSAPFSNTPFYAISLGWETKLPELAYLSAFYLLSFLCPHPSSKETYLLSEKVRVPTQNGASIFYLTNYNNCYADSDDKGKLNSTKILKSPTAWFSYRSSRKVPY